VKHADAWNRLPDLLDDRDDGELLAHVAECTDCQRHLFLLGRVDRALRERAPAARPKRTHRWSRRAVALGAAAAAIAAVLVLLLVPQHGQTHGLLLRTAAGRDVGRAAMTHSDRRNMLVTLTARGLPVDRGHVFLLWAADDAQRSMQVGHFMVDRSGGCRVRFNLPADHDWGRFWITRPGSGADVVAST
jgi:anti-sigma-K factor RskA